MEEVRIIRENVVKTIIFTMLLVIIVMTICLVVWRGNSTEKAEQSFEIEAQFSPNTYVDVKGIVYYKENEYLYMMLENCSKDCLLLGKYGTLFKFIDNSWEQVLFGNSIVTMMAYTLEPGKEMSISVPGGSKVILPEGRYRLVLDAKNEERELVEIIAEFKID